ncbi:MAG: hypothetical protein JST92_25680 [Deltaproteobacteria bacterium]|nr:hypothetical protein [Deltaproteobacteria bacterium]
MSDQPKQGSNGHSNGHTTGTSPERPTGGPIKASIYLQQLVNTERPARMIGLFTMRAMKPHEVERLVGVCLTALREEDQGASLTLSPLGDPNPADMELQRTWRLTIVEYTDAQPHDVLVQLFDMQDPSSPHRGMIDHIANMEEELGQLGAQAASNAQTYLTLASGKLIDQNRIHPFQNVVALFSSALGAVIVDPAAAIVTEDAGEWAEAMEMSLQIEKEIGILKR